LPASNSIFLRAVKAVPRDFMCPIRPRSMSAVLAQAWFLFVLRNWDLDMMRLCRIVAQYLIVTSLAFLNSACLFDDYEAVDEDLSIAITSPSAAQIDTTDPQFTVAGTAQAKSLIESVTWESELGNSGVATGTDSWEATDIPLALGVNTITFFVTDDTGAVASTSIDIRRESTDPASVTLSWQAPSARTDGTPLTNLAGYRIFYGRMSETYDFTIDIANPGILDYVVDGLSPGDWYFVAAAYDSAGMESNFSNEVVRSVQ
jgi:hypothetical protein